MAYDVTKLKQWQIAELAEAKMPTPDEWREKLNLQKDEVIHGQFCSFSACCLGPCSLSAATRSSHSTWPRRALTGAGNTR